MLPWTNCDTEESWVIPSAEAGEEGDQNADEGPDRPHNFDGMVQVVNQGLQLSFGAPSVIWPML